MERKKPATRGLLTCVSKTINARFELQNLMQRDLKNMVLNELYGQVAESDDVIRKPSLVSWLQSLNYLCSNNQTQGSASGAMIDTSNQLASRL